MIGLRGKFLISATCFEDSLPQDLVEVALLGRSNVGKSSLLNAILNEKNLAKSSSTPGKTKLINFFGVSFKSLEIKKFRFVDLPGFGYAKVSKEQQEFWQENLMDFLLKRSAIKIFLQLIDARHTDLKIDKDVNELLSSIKNPDQRIFRVYTKIDKLKRSQISKLEDGAFKVSSSTKQGLEELKQNILEYLFGEGLKSA